MGKKYRIADTTWHVMHQLDMLHALRDDVEFDFIMNSWRQWQDPRFSSVRAIPNNVKFVSHYEKGKYDAAILHLDQQAANPNINKVRIYNELNNEIKDIPKIVINHGTPVYPEFLQEPGMTQDEAQEVCVGRVKKLIGSNTMVVNSHEAASEREWGWGTPLVHGMNPDNWYDGLKEPRIFTALSPGGLDCYYNREVMKSTFNLLREAGSGIFWAKINVSFPQFNDYREFLGKSLIYLDTSTRTPMNRARTEAMLSGCCVVQVKGAHDLDRWAKDGENIILVENNPTEIAKILIDLVENQYDKCLKIGQAGKKMAMKEFSPSRYREDFLSLLSQVTGK